MKARFIVIISTLIFARIIVLLVPFAASVWQTGNNCVCRKLTRDPPLQSIILDPFYTSP